MGQQRAGLRKSFLPLSKPLVPSSLGGGVFKPLHGVCPLFEYTVEFPEHLVFFRYKTGIIDGKILFCRFVHGEAPFET